MDYTKCPICQKPIPPHVIERHVNTHFEDDEFNRDMELAQQLALAPPSPLRNDNSLYMDMQDNSLYLDMPFESVFKDVPESSTSREHMTKNDEPKDIDEQIGRVISSQCKATFCRIEGGLISLLRNCLEHENATSILSGYVDHFQSIRFEDMGWGCGWRNIQMVSSHLLRERPEARELLFGGAGYVPDIGSLQRWLEVAWQRGFDSVGSCYFKGKIYGTKKWIGTTECAALLGSFGLRAKIVDFDRKGSKRNVGRVYGPMDKFVYRRELDTEEGAAKCGDSSSQIPKGYQALIDWVWAYFSKDEPKDLGRHHVVVTNKMPLYFQHHGHSRTIIGIQIKHQHNGTKQHNLLVLDPGHRTDALEKSLRQKSGWQKFFKRGLHTLRKPQYQLCYVDRGAAQVDEMEQLKTLSGAFLESR